MYDDHQSSYDDLLEKASLAHSFLFQLTLFSYSKWFTPSVLSYLPDKRDINNVVDIQINMGISC